MPFFLPISSITIHYRQREIDRDTVGQLKLTIASKGLCCTPRSRPPTAAKCSS